VIDRATFQSLECHTSRTGSSIATELIKGKTAEEALAMKGDELSSPLGPLPPMKIHCAQLVEEALRSTLDPSANKKQISTAPSDISGPTLADQLIAKEQGKLKITLLPK
jgi:NifU-like protein involved in Fe-S cluster formation